MKRGSVTSIAGHRPGSKAIQFPDGSSNNSEIGTVWSETKWVELKDERFRREQGNPHGIEGHFRLYSGAFKFCPLCGTTLFIR